MSVYSWDTSSVKNYYIALKYNFDNPYSMLCNLLQFTSSLSPSDIIYISLLSLFLSEILIFIQCMLMHIPYLECVIASDMMQLAKNWIL